MGDVVFDRRRAKAAFARVDVVLHDRVGLVAVEFAAEAVKVVVPRVVPAEISSCLYRTVETDILR